jgi:hypothetical protein
MKHLLLTIVVLLCALLNVNAVVKTPLLRLNKNEIPGWSEYHFQMKSDGLKYAILALDTITDSSTFIWNGRRIYSDPRLWICDLDLDNLNNCVYIYGARGNRYLIMDGKKIGPYDKISVQTRYPKVRGSSDGGFPYYGGISYTNTHYFLRNEYSYSKNDVWYTVYDDGIVGKSNELKRIYYSHNKEHTATLSEDCRILTIDEHSYILPFDIDESLEIDEYGYGAPIVCLFDDGTCYMEFEYYQRGVKLFGKTKTYCLYVTSNEIIHLKDNEYFDFDDKQIYPISTVKQRYLNQYSKDHGLNQNLVETDWDKRYCPFWKGMTGQDGYPNHVFALTDKSKKHMLSFRYDLPEIYIDGKSVYSGYVLHIYYDDTSNAFCWLTFSNQTIWLHKYQL